jgi:hypothetical protein
MKFEPTPSHKSRDTAARSLYSKESALNCWLIATELMLVYRMHATFKLWNDENPSNVSRDTVEKVLWSAMKSPLFIYQSQPNLLRIYTSRACLENSLYEVWGKCLKWKPRCSWRGTFFLRCIARNCLLIATKLTTLLAQVWEVRSIKFAETHSYGSPNTAEKVLYSQSKVPIQ